MRTGTGLAIGDDIPPICELFVPGFEFDFCGKLLRPGKFGIPPGAGGGVCGPDGIARPRVAGGAMLAMREGEACAGASGNPDIRPDEPDSCDEARTAERLPAAAVEVYRAVLCDRDC